MSDEHSILRYAAFTDTPTGGNPAGVVLDAHGLSEDEMLAIAAELGYSETAFLFPCSGRAERARAYDVRYFSPQAEVPFCGHATVAAAVALAQHEAAGELVFNIEAGPVPVRTAADADGGFVATLTSVTPYVLELPGRNVERALALLGWMASDLDPGLPPRIAYAGARHLILAARDRTRLAELTYDFEGLRAYMLEHDLTTVALVWRRDELAFDVRNAFPIGGVVEDPATGAAAAALGAYLRERGAVTPPARISISQGVELGRPSKLIVGIRPERAEIEVTGRAVVIEAP